MKAISLIKIANTMLWHITEAFLAVDSTRRLFELLLPVVVHLCFSKIVLPHLPFLPSKGPQMHKCPPEKYAKMSAHLDTSVLNPSPLLPWISAHIEIPLTRLYIYPYRHSSYPTQHGKSEIDDGRKCVWRPVLFACFLDSVCAAVTQCKMQQHG